MGNESGTSTCFERDKKKARSAEGQPLKLDFNLPKGSFDHLKLYLLADSYIGADREINLPKLDILEGADSDEDDEDDDEDDEDEDDGA